MNAFGPNTTLVSDCIRRIQAFPWFSRIQQPHLQDNSIGRVPVTWLIEPPERTWRGALAANEVLIEQHLLENGRLGFQVALDRDYRPSFGSALDDLLSIWTSVSPITTTPLTLTRTSWSTWRPLNASFASHSTNASLMTFSLARLFFAPCSTGSPMVTGRVGGARSILTDT